MNDGIIIQKIISCKEKLYPYKEKIMLPVRLILTLNTYLNIVKLFNLPNLRSVKSCHPWIRSKYAKNYLGLSLSYYSRGLALANHYQFLNDHIAQEFLDTLMKDRITLWEETKSHNKFSISLAYPYYDLEGDLTLKFHMNSAEIFTLSVTIIPGHIVELSDKHVILITRSQGNNGSFNNIRSATKILQETTPSSLLIIAVMAIAASLKISCIAGITSREQVIAGAVGSRDKSFSTYEKLWLSVGGEMANDKVCRLPTVLQGKPLNDIRQKHRARTKRKREFKQEVYDIIFQNFEQKAYKTAETSIELGQELFSD